MSNKERITGIRDFLKQPNGPGSSPIRGSVAMDDLRWAMDTIEAQVAKIEEYREALRWQCIYLSTCDAPMNSSEDTIPVYRCSVCHGVWGFKINEADKHIGCLAAPESEEG